MLSLIYAYAKFYVENFTILDGIFRFISSSFIINHNILLAVWHMPHSFNYPILYNIKK